MRASACLATAIALGAIAPAFANPIAPADDGTGTTVIRDGDRFEIDGGQQSGDGANLFHSFDRFGLDAGQIADFLASPEIRNILGRISGGEASFIDGLLRVSGGEANLYLMNPAGILFGPNARLDVPGSFAATAATGIGLGDGGWFAAMGPQDWAALTGEPGAFRFDAAVPGSVVNLGVLAVPAGERLTLAGGTVANAGTLSAPGGDVTIAAVPGESLLRISQAGQVLALEIEPLADPHGEFARGELSPLSLPELLTGAGPATAGALEVTADGRVRLVPANATVDPQAGLAIASGTVDVAAAAGTGGTVTVAGELVAMPDAWVLATGPEGGGTVRVGGDFRGSGPMPNARQVAVGPEARIDVSATAAGDGGVAIAWADATMRFAGAVVARGGPSGGDGGTVEISGKQSLGFSGTVAADASAGQPGEVLFDPTNITIVPGDGGQNDAALDDGQVFAGETAASGEENFTISQFALEAIAGNVVLEAAQNIVVADGLSLNFVESEGGQIAFSAGDSFQMDPTQTLSAPGRSVAIAAGDVTVGTIETLSADGVAGNITLQATSGNLNAGNLVANSDSGPGGAVALEAPGNIATGNVLTFAAGSNPGGSVTAESGGNLETGFVFSGSSSGPGGGVSLKAGNDLTALAVTTQSDGGPAGAIALESGGAIDAGTLNANSGLGSAGTVTVSARTSATMQDLLAAALSGGTGGSVTVTVTEGSLAAGALDASSENAAGGKIALTASDDIEVASLRAEGGTEGGNISAEAGNFFLATDSFVAQTGITASLSTAAPQATTSANGTIVIRHGGGGEIPFAVSGAVFNGTAAAIVRGTEPEAAIASGSFLFDVVQDSDRLQILSGVADPNLPPEPDDPNLPDDSDDPTDPNNPEDSILPGEDSDPESGLGEGAGEETPLTQEELAQSLIAEFGLGEIDRLRPQIESAPILSSLESPELDVGNSPLTDATLGDGSVQVLADYLPQLPEIFEKLADSGNGILDQMRELLADENGQLPAVLSDTEIFAALEGTTFEADIGLPVSVVEQIYNSALSTLTNPLREFSSDQAFVTLETVVDRAQTTTINPGDDLGQALSAFVDGVLTALGEPPVALTFVDASQGLTASNASLEETLPTPVPEDEPSPEPESSPAPEVEEAPEPEPDEVAETPAGPEASESPATPDEPEEETPPQDELPEVEQPVAIAPNETTLSPTEELLAIEQAFTQEVADFLDLPADSPQRAEIDLDNLRSVLNRAEAETGVRSVVIYARFVSGTGTVGDRGAERLRLVLETGAGDPVRVDVPGVTRQAVEGAAQQLRGFLTNPLQRTSTAYLAPAQQLYRWTIAPLETALVERGAENLVFVMDEGLRSLPVAVLHDGEQFLVERYSSGVLPSTSLIFSYAERPIADITQASVLGMGASEFVSLPPLPAVPVELRTVTAAPWTGQRFLNENFTLGNLRQASGTANYGIVHLATHANFQPGDRANSYIQFWGRERLRVDRLRDLNLDRAGVELLVLSACRTAVGSREAELGFAGLSVSAGVKTAVASLWYVDDVATLGLMANFYRDLRSAPNKAEALREAQLRMLRGEARVENGRLTFAGDSLELSDSTLRSNAILRSLVEENDLVLSGTRSGNAKPQALSTDLSHPYYWSGFTMVGTPW